MKVPADDRVAKAGDRPNPSKRFVAACAVAFVIMLILALALAALVKPKVQIVDVTEPQTIVLRTDSKSSVHGIYLHLYGQLEGEASISGAFARQISGKFDIRTKTDCYEPFFELRYVPTDVRSGRVTIEYDFKTF